VTPIDIIFFESADTGKTYKKLKKLDFERTIEEKRVKDNKK
jgi:hypothetical protein